ncbi:DUF7768 domain-containing protein [Arcanobacterium hippocoleae]|uniref:DUF7768 domain-containing protein n=1 Tax=Arcanobacterium hippocoleae TaxID=149017 RepID=UPI00334056D2
MWANNPFLNAEGYADPTAYLAENRIDRAKKTKPGYLTASGVDIQGLKRGVVFVCSPYRGKTKHNVREARRFCHWITTQGVLPIAPHLLLPQFLNDADPKERTQALSLNERLIDLADEVWVLSGVISAGMRHEINYARKTGKTVRFFTRFRRCAREDRCG